VFVCSKQRPVADSCELVRALKNKNQLDATYYFTVLLTGSTCFGHYYVHRQELTTVMLITTLVVSFLGCCRLEVRCGQAGVVSRLQPGHYSSLLQSFRPSSGVQDCTYSNRHLSNRYCRLFVSKQTAVSVWLLYVQS